MPATFKQLTEFFQTVGAHDVAHSDKTYLAHAIGVYNDLKSWGCDEDVSRVGLFHSIYGTELFQGFTLPLERRQDVRDLAGERVEFLSYLNCAMDRTHFDAQLEQDAGPYYLRDRFTSTDLELTDADYHDLCTIHLCDWLEQVDRSQNWDYRRAGYRRLAERLGGVALESYDRVFGREPSGRA